MPDWCVECCWEHDIAWRTGATVDGTPLSIWQANNAFLKCMIERKGYHPRAFARWLGVGLGAIAVMTRRLFNLPSKAPKEPNEVSE